MKRWQWMITLLVLLCTLAACVAPASSGEAAAGKPAIATRSRLIVGEPALTDILDAHQSTNSSYMDIEQIGQALLRIDTKTGELIPDLAESLSFSPDGKAWTIKLPANAKFSNGDPLDAQALKDSWLRYKEISPFGSDLEALNDIKVVDATTMEAHFKNPPAALMVVLETAYGTAWDIAAAKAAGKEAFATSPVASGPLAVKAFTPNSELLLVRNENYHTNLPFVQNKGPLHLAEVQVRAIPEEVTRAGELEAGSIDLLFDAPVSAVERWKTNPDIHIIEVLRPGYTGLVMNHKRPQFADVKVRRAIAQALDRTNLVKPLGAAVAPLYAFLTPAMLDYSPEIETFAQKRYAYNVDTAKAALADAGWKDTDGDGIVEKDGKPFAVEMLVNANDSSLQLVSQVLQTQLKAIGIDVQLRQQEPKAMGEVMTAGEYDMGFDIIGWRDPDIFSLAFAADFWNFPKYNNPTSVEKMDAARHLLKPAERTAAYVELQKLWLEDVVEIPLWQSKLYIAARTWVKGLNVNSVTGQIFLNDVTVEAP